MKRVRKMPQKAGVYMADRDIVGYKKFLFPASSVLDAPLVRVMRVVIPAGATIVVPGWAHKLRVNFLRLDFDPPAGTRGPYRRFDWKRGLNVALDLDMKLGNSCGPGLHLCATPKQAARV